MAPEATVGKEGRYELREPIARGGMATVWLGWDARLEREVAIKIVELPSEVAGDEGDDVRRRAMREARAAGRLVHPATVTVFDVFEDQGRLYVVMELVEGETLADLVDRVGPLPAPEVARIGGRLLDALDTAHGHGIVHRDVKPANVMVTSGGTVKLGDFGIAWIRDHPTITRTGQITGSPAYMAPEQAQGQPTGPAADLWALGATLYHAAEGRSPFEREGGAVATMHAVVHEEPHPARRAGPLAPLLTALLAKEPARRPDAGRVRQWLAELAAPPAATVRLDGATTVVDAPPVPTERRPAEAPAGSPPAAPRRPVPATAPASGRRPWGGVAAVLLLVVAAAAALVFARSGSDGGAGDGAGDDVAEAPESEGDDRAPADAGGGADTAGWVSYRDPDTGYRIAHPPGWSVVEVDRTRTDFRQPGTGTYLRVDWTDQPGDSPEGAWRRLAASFARRHRDYREVRIEPTEFQGHDAAIWEYTYRDGQVRLRAVDLGFVTGRYGFALNFQSRAADWDDAQPTFQAFKDSFRAPE